MLKALTILIAGYILAVGVIACDNIEHSAPAPEAERTCILIAPMMSEQVWNDLTSTWGPLDYIGGNPGKVIAPEHGDAVLGYAAAEDSDLWNLPECVAPNPLD